MRTFKQFFTEQVKDVVAILPGGFKPPTKGHFNALNYLLTDASRGVVFIGNKERDGITPEHSLKLWQIYSKYTSKPIEVQISPKTPVSSVYEYADANKNSRIIVGAGNKDEDIRRYDYFNRNIDKYPLVQVVKIPIQSEGISGTLTRSKIASNINEAINYFVPDAIKTSPQDVALIKKILSTK